MKPMPSEVADVRRQICRQAGCVHTPDYADPCAVCPAGHWKQWTRQCRQIEPAPTLLQRLALGTRIEKLAKPIAKVLGLPCLEKDGTLQPKSPCAQRRDLLDGKRPPSAP